MNFSSIFFTLFFIQDAIGNVPVVLSLLQPFTMRKRVWIIIREGLFAFLLLTIFLLYGQGVLKKLSISTDILSLTGGILLFFISLNMLFPSKTPRSFTVSSLEKEPFIVPIATPLLAGPSAIATVTLFTSKYPQQLKTQFLALLTVCICSTFILLLSLTVYRLISSKFLQACEKLIGIILMTMALQMSIDGLVCYLKVVAYHSFNNFSS